MAFTDKFIKLPVEIVRRANESLGLQEQSLAVTDMRFNPLEIINYRIHYDDDGNADNKTEVDFKYSDSVTVHLSIDEFEKYLNYFMK